MNMILYRLVEHLSQFNLPIELGICGMIKFNRAQQDYVKDHWIDAACIGNSGSDVIISSKIIPLNIKVMERGLVAAPLISNQTYPL